MTNREKYKEELLDIIESNSAVAIVKGKPIKCKTVFKCDECDLFDGRVCVDSDKLKKWMQSEYREPEIDWSKVPVDTKIFVRNCKDDKWIPGYFAGYEDNIVYAFENGRTSFSLQGYGDVCWNYDKLAVGKNE